MKSFVEYVKESKPNFIDKKLFNKLNEIARFYSGFKTSQEFNRFNTELEKYGVNIEPAYAGNEKVAPDGTKKWILNYTVNGELAGQVSFSINEGNPYKKEYLVYFLR